MNEYIMNDDFDPPSLAALFPDLGDFDDVQGATTVDAMRAQIERLTDFYDAASTLDEVLLYLRAVHRDDLAERLQEIAEPEEEGDEPLQVASVKDLLRFLGEYSPMSRALIGATPEGVAGLTLIQGDDWLTLRFRAHDDILIEAHRPREQASSQVTMQELLKHETLIRAELW